MGTRKNPGPCRKKRRSTAVRDAGRSPNPNMKPRAKPDALDDRPSQRAPGRPVPSATKITKGQYEKIPGTRIQSVPGGAAVRIILEDGTKLEPGNVRRARMYLAKLAKQADEIARVRGEELQTRKGTHVVQVVSKVSKRPPTADQPPPSKKTRKAKAWQEKQQKIKEVDAARVVEENRQMASQDWFAGEVVQRMQGQVLVKLENSAGLSEPVLMRLRQTSGELMARASSVSDGECLGCRAGDDVLLVRFADVAEKGLHLQPGVALKFKIYTCIHGVGGCEAAAATSPAAEPAVMEARRVGEDGVHCGVSPEKQHADVVAALKGAADQATKIIPVACVSRKESEIPTFSFTAEEPLQAKESGNGVQAGTAETVAKSTTQMAAAPTLVDGVSHEFIAALAEAPLPTPRPPMIDTAGKATLSPVGGTHAMSVDGTIGAMSASSRAELGDETLHGTKTQAETTGHAVARAELADIVMPEMADAIMANDLVSDAPMADALLECNTTQTCVAPAGASEMCSWESDACGAGMRVGDVAPKTGDTKMKVASVTVASQTKSEATTQQTSSAALVGATVAETSMNAEAVDGAPVATTREIALSRALVELATEAVEDDIAVVDTPREQAFLSHGVEVPRQSSAELTGGVMPSEDGAVVAMDEEV